MSVFTIKRGASFSGKPSTIGLVLSIFTLCGLFITIGLGSTSTIFVVLALAIPIGFITVRMACAFEGVDFDLEAGQFREYRVVLVGKTGTWESLEEYDELALDIARFRVIEENYAGEEFSVPEQTFFILLRSTKNDENVVLAEWPEYRDAKKDLKRIADQLRLPVRNYFAEAVAEAKARRR